MTTITFKDKKQLVMDQYPKNGIQKQCWDLYGESFKKDENGFKTAVDFLSCMQNQNTDLTNITITFKDPNISAQPTPTPPIPTQWTTTSVTPTATTQVMREGFGYKNIMYYLSEYGIYLIFIISVVFVIYIKQLYKTKD